jgi:hypothetical protein
MSFKADTSDGQKGNTLNKAKEVSACCGLIELDAGRFDAGS